MREMVMRAFAMWTHGHIARAWTTWQSSIFSLRHKRDLVLRAKQFHMHNSLNKAVITWTKWIKVSIIQARKNFTVMLHYMHRTLSISILAWRAEVVRRKHTKALMHKAIRFFENARAPLALKAWRAHAEIRTRNTRKVHLFVAKVAHCILRQAFNHWLEATHVSSECWEKAQLHRRKHLSRKWTATFYVWQEKSALRISQRRKVCAVT